MFAWNPAKSRRAFNKQRTNHLLMLHWLIFQPFIRSIPFENNWFSHFTYNAQCEHFITHIRLIPCIICICIAIFSNSYRNRFYLTISNGVRINTQTLNHLYGAVIMMKFIHAETFLIYTRHGTKLPNHTNILNVCHQIIYGIRQNS